MAYSYKKGSKSFINPYNFVSLPAKVKKSAYQEGNLTGYLDVSLETLTPLFIPNTTNEHYYYPENTEHKSEDFYSYEDLSGKTGADRKNYAPVIPGSELRGCIKSIHEIQNDSCMANTDYDMYFARRASSSKGKNLTNRQRNMGNSSVFAPYILFWVNDRYYLYEAKKNPMDLDCPSDTKRYFHSDILPELKASDNNKFIDVDYDGNYMLNTLHEETNPQIVLNKHLYFCRIGEPFHVKTRDDKKYDNYMGEFKDRALSFYELTGSYLPVSDDEIKRFRKTLEDYSDSRINKNTKDELIDALKKAYEENDASALNKLIKFNYAGAKSGHTGYLDVLYRLEHHLPVLVFVMKNYNQKSLSPANIGKYMCPDDLNVFLKGYEPCKSLDDCCLTCQIFGFIDQSENNDGETHSSRVRFTDATTSLNPDACYDSWRSLKPLLGPHPSNAIVYGYNPGNHNYREWAWDKATGIKVRGRKLYFHSNVLDKTRTDVRDKFNLTMHPVKKGVSFSFKVYYENLTKEQLESLIKSINLYNSINSKYQYAHKIGHAKPFGYGSVRMKVENIIQRKVEKEDGHIVYKETPINVRSEFNEDNSSSDKQLKVMTNTYLLNHNEIQVIYPITDSFKNDDDKGFEWFGNNVADSQSNTCTQILPYLPEVIMQNIDDYPSLIEKLSLESNYKQ